jgi:FixJ family two-component response regulator
LAVDQIIFVVDDDPRMRSSLTGLFDSMGIANMVFGSASEYVAAEKPDTVSCLLLDVNLPGTGKELIARAIHGSSSRRGRAFVKLN